MNFTPELAALQGVMISADNANSFSQLTVKGGYEEEIEKVILRVKDFLVKENYASINDNNMVLNESKIESTRKFAFYIILNSDLKNLESMVDKDGINFLIWTLPTIPKCLMCELLWKLHMDKFIYEMIAYSSPELSIEIAEAFANHMRYFSPLEIVDKLKTFSAACYKLICRLNFVNNNENMLNSTYSTFQKCLIYFASPTNYEKLKNLGKYIRYRHLGDTVFKLLSLINGCIEEFYAVQKFQLKNDIDFYMLTYDEESTIAKDDFKIVNCSENVLNYIHKCHNALMDILSETLMGVDIETFCAWSEMEYNGKTMQKTVGEHVYKLLKILMKVESLANHPVISMLEQIAIKPIQIEDIINTTETLDIVENINHDENKDLWVQALLKRDDLCHNLILLETIIPKLNVLSGDDFHKLYNKCVDHINNFSENEDTVKQLAIRVFQLCDIATKENIVDDTFNNNCFSDDMMAANFDVMMIEIFNKLIDGHDKDFSDVLAVFLQSPKHVYRKIFISATENIQQSVIMGDIMKYLHKYSQYYYKTETEPCITKMLQHVISSELDTEKKQNNFISLIKFMKEHSIISVATLILLVIMPALHEALLNKTITNIYIQLKMLSVVFSLNDLLNYRAPMLAMISQVLEVVRWKIHTFDSQAPTCLELAIRLQQNIMNTYSDSIPDKESAWLKSKLKNKNPLNMFYYKAFWNPPGKTYFQILTGIPVNDGNDIPKLSFYFSQILPSTILDEWYLLWHSLLSLRNNAKLNIFHSAMVLILSAEKDNRTNKTWACILHCFKNFILVTRHKYIQEPVSDEQVVTIINNIGMLANFLGDDKKEELESVLLPLLAYIAERGDEYNMNVPACIESSTNNLVLKSLAKKLFSCNDSSKSCENF